VGLVAGPSSPARLDLRTEDSTSCGAKRLLSRGGGEGDRGDGLGVSSSAGMFLRYFSKVVSIGMGANRSRGRSRVLAIVDGYGLSGVSSLRGLTEGALGGARAAGLVSSAYI